MKYKLESGIITDTDDGQHIAEQCEGALVEQMDRIVLAVNAHDDLLAALELLVQSMSDIINAAGNGEAYTADELADIYIPDIDKAKAVIDQIGGE